MSTHTLYLDFVILASAAYPSGLSYSLFTALRGHPARITTGLLATLLLPFAAVVPAVWLLRPSLFVFRVPAPAMLAVAVLTVPVALLGESLVQAIAVWRATGVFPRRIELHGLWQNRLSLLDHVLVVLIASGEEMFFRMIWLGAMIAGGVPAGLALAVSSVAYGLNHMFAGGTAAVAKSITGLLYGALYLLGGGSVLLPIVAHVLQNAALFSLTRERT
ncbi:MAG: CPBP family glutamic-type intramembrane protease [Thermoanaerobaculia bacterium]